MYKRPMRQNGGTFRRIKCAESIPPKKNAQMNPVRWEQVWAAVQNDILKVQLDVRLAEDEPARLHVKQMFHFTVKIHLASVELLCMSPSQLLCRAPEERSHISLSGDRLEIKVLIIHSGLLPGNRPPLTELVCWLKRSKDEKKMTRRTEGAEPRDTSN